MCFPIWNIHRGDESAAGTTMKTCSARWASIRTSTANPESSRAVMGPWFHGGWARSDGDWLGTAYFGSRPRLLRETFELPFFIIFERQGDISQIKELNVFDTGANQWIGGLVTSTSRHVALSATRRQASC